MAKVVVPREQKGNGEIGSGSQVAATQQPAESGQLSDTSVVTERGRPREEVEAEEEQPIPPPSTFGDSVQEVEPVKATSKGKGRGKKSSKGQEDATMESANSGQLPVTEGALPLLLEACKAFMTCHQY